MTGAGRRKAKPIAAAAAAAFFVALLGATITDLGDWYQQLNKPSWQPPDWLFGPAWTLIFALAALAAVQGWTRVSAEGRYWLLGLFSLNGFLNILWSILFFRLQRPDWALLEVALLWLSIFFLIGFLSSRSRAATWLLTPYLLWVTFAAFLNLAVVRLNAPF